MLIKRDDIEDLTKEEQEFIKATGYLFKWEECEGLLGPDDHWIEKGDMDLSKALKLIKAGYTPLPF